MTKLIEIDIDIDDEVLLTLSLEAHKLDITLNAYIIKVLMDYVKKQEKRRNWEERTTLSV